jgi:hypothetical protein
MPLPEHSDTTYMEGTAELMEFYQDHKDAIIERYKVLSARENPGDLFRRKGFAHTAARDYAFENGREASDCQLNRLAEVIVSDCIMTD